MIKRLLVANRGEIAVRIARAAQEMGIASLGIYSEADADAYHLAFMDDARCVGPATPRESYLDAGAILAAGRAMKADALHPGYGFLSERASFARAATDAGLTFVGPTPEAMAAMGSKIEAKQRVRAFSVPTVPGYDGGDQSQEALRAAAMEIGFPLLIKASAGGGGRGMRVVETVGAFDEALEAAKREALAAFGDDTVLLERYLRNPRHIEFQILADRHGTTIHLGERECSIQRRHQKIVEEAPSVALTPALRSRMGAAAVRAAESVNYTNAGTCEFMLDTDGAYYFLEMNARLQVEHPVTEMVHGVDLVQWQLRIAAGEPLTLEQSKVQPRGCSIEARLYAEDPSNHMLPSIGRIRRWSPPQGPGVRVDAGVTTGSDVSHYYDPMLAKLIVFASDRDAAIARLRRALGAFEVEGVRTNLPLLRWIADDAGFRAGETTTRFLTERLDESIFARTAAPDDAVLLCTAGLLLGGHAPWRVADVGVPLRLLDDGAIIELVADAIGPGLWHISGDRTGELHAERHADAVRATFGGGAIAGGFSFGGDDFTVNLKGRAWTFSFAPGASIEAATVAKSAASETNVVAPMPGKIIKVAVRPNDRVDDRALLVVLEAMKMEHRIEASSAAVVKAVLAEEGQIVSAGTPLVELQ